MRLRNIQVEVNPELIQESKCIVCNDTIKKLSNICEKSSCREFYSSVILPIEEIISLIEKEEPDWSDYYKSFLKLSLTAQCWLLAKYPLESKVYWESLNLLNSNDLWMLISSNDDFRGEFYSRIIPELKDEVYKEVQSWFVQDSEKNSLTDSIAERLESIIFFMLEHVSSIMNDDNRTNNK